MFKVRFRTVLAALVCFAVGALVQRLYDSHEIRVARSTRAERATDQRAGDAHPSDRAARIRFDREPLWAYGFERPPLPGEKAAPQAAPTHSLRANEDPDEQTRPRRIPASRAAYSLVDIRDGQNVIDWFPADHPRMPDVVEHGPAAMGPLKRGCASCHLPNGKGRPENAPPAGLPVAYFSRQIQDFRAGLRRSADPRKPNTYTMIDLAKAMTDREVKEAADYFGAIRWTPWIRVVETTAVPRTRISGNLFLPVDPRTTEPIGNRIIEVPEDVEQAELFRNPRSGFVAYVPPGSIARGRDLVMTGGAKVLGNTVVQGKTTPCVTCHGMDLMGVADVPPIAGRSPSYLVRQIWDIQQGTRNGAAAQLMKLVIANLDGDDMIAIAAFIASRTPPRVNRPTHGLTATER